jgi:putative endonuclease
MNPRRTKNLGNLGERLARRYLEERGFTFLEANFQWPGGEIDLVMKSEDRIVFVEVKLRTTREYAPHEAVDKRKQLRLARTSEVWLKKHRLYERVEYGIDVVEIFLVGRVARIRHFKNAVSNDGL